MIPPAPPSTLPLSTVEARLLAALRRLDGARVYQLAEELGREYPVTQELLDALAIRGWILTAPASDKRKAFEEALRGCIDQALAFTLDDLEDRAARQQEIPGSLGWYLGDVVGLAKRGAVPEAAPVRLPVLDLAWLDQLPEPRRAEAHAAWTAKAAEVESTFAPPAVPHVLASSAEALRLEFTQQAGGAP